jgi:hypothetical protein
MSEQTITELEQIQPAWLTHVLRRSSALESGEVTKLEMTSEDSKFARIAKLQIMLN